jgi:hypothetical protein
MKADEHMTLYVEDAPLSGHAQAISLRSYKPATRGNGFRPCRISMAAGS